MDKRIDRNELKLIWLFMVVMRRRWNFFILCYGWWGEYDLLYFREGIGGGDGFWSCVRSKW